MDPLVEENLRNLVDHNKVLIFMKGTPEFPQCGFSAAVVRTIASYGYPFESVDVLSNSDIRQGIKEFSNWPTIPQIYVDGEFVGGCDIALEMHARGELEPLIKAAVEGVTAQ